MERIERALTRMKSVGLDALVIGPSPDFTYFTGRTPRVNERLTALVVCEKIRPAIVHPGIEAGTLAGLENEFDLMPWGETERATLRVSALLRDAQAESAAFNDDLWSAFLLDIQSELPQLRCEHGGRVMVELRSRKDDVELELLAEASRRIDLVWEEFSSTFTLTGASERQISRRIRELMAANGLDGVGWCDVGSGPNGALPLHHVSDRVVQAGDPVLIDYAGAFNGYFGDTCRTPVAQRADEDFAAVYQIVKEAQQAAFRACRPGAQSQEPDRVARGVIADAGYGDFFNHRVGHGIGLASHEDPYIVEGNKAPLLPGMVFSDEPGIYLPGRWGVRIEDIVAVTDESARRLNDASRELTVMG